MKDFLIIGQGAAGSFLALELLKHDKDILIVDDDHKSSSSIISAGIINPVTGKRFAITEDFDEYFACAKEVYQQLEAQFSQKFFEPMDILRVFQNESERDHWQRKVDLDDGQQYSKKTYINEAARKGIKDPLGSVHITQSGFCYTERLLRQLKRYFKDKEILVNDSFNYEDLRIKKEEVVFRDETFRTVIFCEGYKAQWNPWFSWVPFNSVKGEILGIEIEADNLPHMIINKGKWCAPVGQDKWMAGSSYIWEHLDCVPTEEAREQIIAGLQKCFDYKITVTEHKAGVRPVIKDQKALMGRHPQHDCLAVFNGLGSKGFLMAPLCARELADHLCEGSSLRKDFALDRFKMELE